MYRAILKEKALQYTGIEMLGSCYRKLLDALFPATCKEALVKNAQALLVEPQYKNTPAGSDVLSVSTLKDTHVRACIHTLKYKGNKRAAELLAHALHEVLLAHVADTLLWDTASHVLIPVPLSKKRKRKRGFNQIEHVLETCMHISKALPIATQKDFIERIRDTQTQTTLTKKQRLENVRGAFKAAQHLRDATHTPCAHYIIVDDVVTTGATLHECKAALIDAGIPEKEITLLALARA